MDGFDGFEEGVSMTRNGRLSFLNRSADGQPIVFLHGLGASIRTWRKLLPFIPEGLDVYLVDLLGHGQSDVPTIDYDIMTQVNSVRDMATDIGLYDPIIFGHSYGAWVATHYSTANRVKGLILEDSAGLEAQVGEIISSGKKDDYTKELVAESLKIGANETVMRSIASNFDKYLLTKDVLSKVSANTLLVWGSDDAIVPTRFGEWERGLISGSRLTMVEGGGHVPHWTKPDVVGNMIAEFCARL
jgi:2-hydroxy-6-oxonona-2,4-dienedioate hydrolase